VSDRIDRLVNRANNVRLEGWENAQAVHDLATIAREAEAKLQTHMYTFHRNDTTLRAEADKWRKVAEAGVCPVCHIRSRGGYWRDEHGLGHVCTHAYHAALAAVEQEEAE